MAPPAGTLRVGRYFLALLAIVAVLYAIVFWPGQRHTPKLGLDLVGGTQVIFTAKTDNGTAPSSSSMEQAKQIMEERVNGSGVTEATVIIQGSDQIVVSIPGSTSTDVQKLGAAAQLNFRGLVAPATQVACIPKSTATSGSSSSAPGTTPSSGAPSSPGTSPSTTPAGASPSGSPSLSGAAAAEHPLAKASPTSPAKASVGKSSAATASSTPSAGGSGTPGSSATSSAPAAPPCSATSVADAAKAGNFAVPLTDTAFAKLTQAQQTAVTTALQDFDCASAQAERDDPKSYFVACDTSGLAHLLGLVIVPGKQVSTAAAVAPNISGGQTEWTVSLTLKSGGQSAWAAYTSKHNIGGGGATSASGSTACGGTGTPCADYVAFTLDGIVISAPVNEETINGQATQISGGFTQSSATDLANKLKFGALPLSFKAEQAQTVSATLGSSQLKSGLLAGGIGLVLVVIYSLIYYRALGLVTISSLLVSGALTYGSLVMLATQIGFTLSLAGIAGFIVAVGITADSFVVFFERIKDEVHDGRSMRVAIPRAWVRARRTILSADTVSFLAAAILYYFAAGDVRGFAFTLGLSTILDLAVVFLFTHPLISLLSRSKAFGSARFTGLNAAREGGIVVNEPREPVRRANAGPREARRPAGQAPASSVAVMDAPAVEEVAEVTPTIDVPAVTPAVASPGEGGPVDPASADAVSPPVDDATPARRTPPEPGSAAERAAARRTRLRQQRDEKGKS